LHLFPLVSGFDAQVTGSSIARPLVGAAGNTIRIGAPADSANHT
jgi:hypothetical protein